MTAELIVNFGGVPLALSLGENLAASVSDAAGKKRLRTLARLQTSIARVGFQLPTLAAALPTIGAATAATSIATGTSWQITSGGVDTHRSKYTLLGGTWAPNSAAFPDTEAVRPFTYHAGNGTDPTTNFVQGVGRVRFSTAAPKFDLWMKEGDANNGIRLFADGKLLKTGMLGNGSSNFRYIPITWGTGVAADRDMRNYELEFGPQGQFVGIRTENIYRVEPWPQPDGLRVVVHGDSFIQTIVDSGSIATARYGALGAIMGNVLGQADVYASGVGGTGWVNSNGGVKSTFNQRFALDVVAFAPDVVIELGGGNDESVLTAGTTTQAQYQALVTTWVSTIIAANPAVIILMSGPVIVANGAAVGHQMVSTVKAAVAALYPKNVAFFNNIATADPWVTGTGKQGTTTADGNADWVRGSDNAHPTIEGHAYLTTRIIRAISAAIPALIAAQ